MRRSSLDAVIPILRQMILAEVLVRSKGAPLYRGELARRLGVSPSTLTRPLREMVQTGILKASNRGREVLFEPENSNPVIPELTGLLRKTRGLLDVLRDALEPIRDDIQFAFVYGSMASGAERPGSDVDLMVVGDATLGAISPLLDEPQRMLGREVNAVTYSRDEFRKKVEGRSHFVSSVLDKPRLFIVGSEHDLGRALEGRAGRTASHKQGRTRGPASRRASKSR